MRASAEQSEIPVKQKRAALNRVVSSKLFHKSPQLQRLLTYVVDETLAGRSDHLKEYSIGTEVFARPASYDPRLDSLVRVEAKRLRMLLDEYYSSEGESDPVRIEVPKGAYVPSFTASVTKEAKGYGLRLWGLVLASLALFASGLWFLVARRATSSSDRSLRTVAVLPFENLSGDHDNDYFCFGLMDGITTDLAKHGDLRVIARTTASRFNRKDDIASISKRLNADAIVEGSVSRWGSKVRITAQLINSADSVHLWAETYERNGSDPLIVQNEVARAVARAVSLKLAPTSREVAATQYSSDAEANKLYWKGGYFRVPRGRSHWREDLQKSAAFLEQATERDPQFALAFAALSDVYAQLAFEGNGGPVNADNAARVRRTALRALELDSNSAEALGSLAVVQAFYDWDWRSAEQNFQRALALAPQNARVQGWYALALIPQGRLQEALNRTKLARELDPLSFTLNNNLGVILYLAGDLERSEQCAKESLTVEPDFAPAYALYGMIHERRRQYVDAASDFRQGLVYSPGHSFMKGRLGHALALSGERAKAAELVAEMVDRRDPSNYSDVHIAYVYEGLGDSEAVFKHLERAFQRRDPDLPYISVDPIFEPLRENSRFVEVLHKIGLSGKPS